MQFAPLHLGEAGGARRRGGCGKPEGRRLHRRLRGEEVADRVRQGRHGVELQHGRDQVRGGAVTPACQIGYTDYTGCHQLVF